MECVMKLKRDHLLSLWGKYLRLALSFLMLGGNTLPFLAIPIRMGLTAVISTLLTSTQAFARNLKNASNAQAQGKVVDYRQINLSDNPSDADFLTVRCFDELFVPATAPPVAGENVALAQALKDTLVDLSDET